MTVKGGSADPWVMMASMTGRVLVWVGSVVTVLGLVGLGVYFMRAGLGKADELASVVGVFVAVLGLGVTVYGLYADRRKATEPVAGAPAVGERSISVEGDGTGIASTGNGASNVQLRAKASRHSRVYQVGRDQNIKDQ